MSDCELLCSCPFFNDRTQDTYEMVEMLKEQYCKGDYTWCGRYITFKALKKELHRENLPLSLFSRDKIKTKVTGMARNR